MARVSDAVHERIKELYAVLATVAAKTAFRKADFGNAADADVWAKQTEKWLAKAGANHARFTYEKPKS